MATATNKNDGVTMPEKEVGFIEAIRQALPYLSTFALSCFGGFVSYVRQIKAKGLAFSWKELAFELAISSFVGLVTYFFCEHSGITGPAASILIAINAHMGTRAIVSFERLRDRVFGDEPSKPHSLS